VKIVFPAQSVHIDTPGGIDPIWYEKLKLVETFIGSGAIGAGVLATNATTGFAFLPTCAGAPTGVPVAMPGFVPAVFDTTNRKLWIFTGGVWRGVVLA
jgi:hypothetical protein